MTKPELTARQRRLDADLWIILLVTAGVFGAYAALRGPIAGWIRNTETPVLLRVLLAAAIQFGIAGLGMTIVTSLRRERFADFGLRARGTPLSIALCACCFAPNVIFTLVTAKGLTYLPFGSVWTTREVLSSAFPVNAAGMLITAAAWGFFEGFNYVVISEKINERYPVKSKWLNVGALVCAVLCVLIHGALGVTAEGVLETLTILIIVYGMLMVKQFTGNAWGCVFAFVFLWNAYQGI